MPRMPGGVPGFQMPKGLMPTFTQGFSAFTVEWKRWTKRFTLSRRQSSRVSLPPDFWYLRQLGSSGNSTSFFAAVFSG